jgi:sugar phosphate isomerase/epimerase
MKCRTRIVAWLVVLMACLCGGTAVGAPQPPEAQLGWGIGATCYTFRSFTFVEAVDKAGQLGLGYLEGLYGQKLSPDFPGAMDENMTDDSVAKVKAKLQSADVRLASMWYGKLPSNETQCRQIFAWLRKLDVKSISSEPDLDALDMVERLCREYGMKVGIHNHPKPRSLYWNCDTLVQVLQGRQDLGACADPGHWLRSDVDAVQAVRKLRGKIVLFHLKDPKKVGNGWQYVPWGTGDLDLKGILEEAARRKGPMVFYIEYEPKWHSGSMDHLAANVAFFRNVVREIVARGAAPGAG